MLKDQFGRVHNYLRISLTDNCNLRCLYCMPDENHEFTRPAYLMQAEEIEILAKIFVQLGVNKIRLTGGEPLVRKDVADIIFRLAKLPVKLTLTTNGTILHKYMNVLEKAGMFSINISLDTLQADTFKYLTRRDEFQQVINNIQLCIKRKFHVKVNVVVMKGLNDGEINDFIQWTKDTPVHIRFIEFMPFSGNQWSSNKVFTWQNILQIIEQQYSFHPLSNEEHATAKSYTIPGHAGTFSVISTMSAPFCNTCNRLRLTADGKIKNCLFAEHEVDLLTPLRKGEEVKGLILENIASKAKELGGQFTSNFEHINTKMIQNRSMIEIGG